MKKITVGTITVVDTPLTYKAPAFAARLWGLKVDGIGLGGGVLHTRAGVNGGTFAPVMIVNPNSGAYSPLLVSGGAATFGVQMFESLCHWFEFEVIGGADPNINIVLFPQPRPAV